MIIGISFSVFISSHALPSLSPQRQLKEEPVKNDQITSDGPRLHFQRFPNVNRVTYPSRRDIALKSTPIKEDASSFSKLLDDLFMPPSPSLKRSHLAFPQFPPADDESKSDELSSLKSLFNAPLTLPFKPAFSLFPGISSDPIEELPFINKNSQISGETDAGKQRRHDSLTGEAQNTASDKSKDVAVGQVSIKFALNINDPEDQSIIKNETSEPASDEAAEITRHRLIYSNEKDLNQSCVFNAKISQTDKIADIDETVMDTANASEKIEASIFHFDFANMLSDFMNSFSNITSAFFGLDPTGSNSEERQLEPASRRGCLRSSAFDQRECAAKPNAVDVQFLAMFAIDDDEESATTIETSACVERDGNEREAKQSGQTLSNGDDEAINSFHSHEFETKDFTKYHKSIKIDLPHANSPFDWRDYMLIGITYCTFAIILALVVALFCKGSEEKKFAEPFDAKLEVQLQAKQGNNAVAETKPYSSLHKY